MGLSQSLPVTSYIKMIDIWMLFTMIIPFLEVVLHTTHEVFKNVPETRVGVLEVKSGEEDEVEKEEKNNNIMNLTLSKMMGSLMLPILSLGFIIIFWTVGLIHACSSSDVLDFNMFDCLAIDLA